jgi:hypothetical protein
MFGREGRCAVLEASRLESLMSNMRRMAIFTLLHSAARCLFAGHIQVRTLHLAISMI